MLFRSLQKVLEGIGKMLMMLLRPIGDMLAALFMPLMMLIKPLGIFINALFRPYIQEARKNFMAAANFYKLGMAEKGTEAMFVGLEQLATPLIKLLVIAIGKGLELSIDIIFKPFEVLLEAFQNLGVAILKAVGLGDAAVAFENEMIKIRNGVTGFKDDLKAGIQTGIDIVLLEIDKWNFKLTEQGKALQEYSTIASDIITKMKEDQKTDRKSVV